MTNMHKEMADFRAEVCTNDQVAAMCEEMVEFRVAVCKEIGQLTRAITEITAPKN